MTDDFRFICIGGWRSRTCRGGPRARKDELIPGGQRRGKNQSSDMGLCRVVAVMRASTLMGDICEEWLESHDKQGRRRPAVGFYLVVLQVVCLPAVGLEPTRESPLTRF